MGHILLGVYCNEFCKMEVRHRLFKKIRLLIFLNSRITNLQVAPYCLKRRNQKPFSPFQTMPNLNFARAFLLYVGLPQSWCQIAVHLATALIGPAAAVNPFSFSSSNLPPSKEGGKGDCARANKMDPRDQKAASLRRQPSTPHL